MKLYRVKASGRTFYVLAPDENSAGRRVEAVWLEWYQTSPIYTTCVELIAEQDKYPAEGVAWLTIAN